MQSGHISIWFFIGVLLTVYGAMIFGDGVFDLVTRVVPKVVLGNLHAPVWWGAMLLILGLFYGIRFRPGRNG
jgi:hypothetical protein